MVIHLNTSNAECIYEIFQKPGYIMDNHPIETLMRSTMENLKDMIDVNTIIGDPVNTGDGTMILPISKVSFGFASGGSEFATEWLTAFLR